MTDIQRPESISGGCLCGAIRFTITFPDESDWPPLTNSVCHCTRCRKHTGCLYLQGFGVPVSNLSPPLEFNSSYKTYSSTPDTGRGFCSSCGSSIAFHDKREPDIVEVNVGALDEEVLIGRKDEEKGARWGGWGKVLGTPSRHIFCENEIPGVTDGFEGDKWLRDTKDGERFRGKARDPNK